jgi:predicted Rossmann fold nucleotide-binding protein DprA/Smf involved in DNA uptake
MARQAFQRNGTICELSRAVIVAEAQRMSGAMNTVRQFLKKQVPLFVVTYENYSGPQNSDQAIS